MEIKDRNYDVILAAVYNGYTNSCIIETKISYLGTEFGLELAKRKTGLSEKEIERLVGRYTKGKYKGNLKGAVSWGKITKGGFYKRTREHLDGFVVYKNTSFGYHIVDEAYSVVFIPDEYDIMCSNSSIRIIPPAAKLNVSFKEKQSCV